MRFWLSIAAVSGLAAATAGCSSLPSQGPSALDIVQQGTPADPEVAPRFLITDLNEYSVSVLEHTPLPSLYGRFGDHRAPPSPVIGVGDALAVTVWEAAAGAEKRPPAAASHTVTDSVSPTPMTGDGGARWSPNRP